MGLSHYSHKRDFSKTPEPRGQVDSTRGGSKLAFVVQEHHATRLHYDFRLELDGVLKSWAIPKGPSLNPHDHHLAIQTEDHPYEYRTFEGVIPEGNYGAGNVIIWDEGWYEPRADGVETLRAGLKKGHLTFVLHGKKLQGEFALVKMPNANEDNAWLLIKKDDEYASTREVTQEDQSVESGRRVDELGASGKLPDLSRYPKKSSPWRVQPMLCTLADQPFSRDGWFFEIKWDGYRAIGSHAKDAVELYSRTGHDFMEQFPPVAQAMRDFKHDVIVDGEIVVMDSDGVPHFEWLQNWHQDQEGMLRYCLFDILWCDGHDVRTMPLSRRKALLHSVIPKHPIFQYSDHLETEGEKLFTQMRQRNLEGMVAKRADSPYQEGVRGTDWLKVKTHLRQEVVIGGYTEPRGGRTYLGSLLTGVYDDQGRLFYVGHSGGGIPERQRRLLRDELAKLERKTSPFATEPEPNAPVHWVGPKLVAEMSFGEWTSDGLMRHPQYRGLRPDKDPLSVRREQPAPVPTDKSSGQNLVSAQSSRNLPFEPTHLDKVFFPKHRYTKGDLIKYYETVADYILPYLKDRPCSLNRMPDGINGPSFYQKNNEHLPDWVPHADIFSDSNQETLRWIVGGELDTLLYMAQLGCIEVNPWNSRVDRLEYPDWIVIDLDPETTSFENVIQTARTVKDVCDDWGIPTYPKTSGKTGLHIYIPTRAKYNYEQVKNLAHLIAIEVYSRLPRITSVERPPEKRQRRVYLDYLQNRAGQTLAAPYSVRPTPDATVSMPLYWEEVKPGFRPTDFTIQSAIARLRDVGDLWKPVLGPGIDLVAVLKKIEKDA